MALDRTRLTVTVSGLGLTGFKADEILAQHHVIAELPSLQHLTFISLGNTEADIELLVQAFTILSRENRGSSAQVASASGCQSDPNLYLFEFNFPAMPSFPQQKHYLYKTADDHISAELVCSPTQEFPF